MISTELISEKSIKRYLADKKKANADYVRCKVNPLADPVFAIHKTRLQLGVPSNLKM